MDEREVRGEDRSLAPVKESGLDSEAGEDRSTPAGRWWSWFGYGDSPLRLLTAALLLISLLLGAWGWGNYRIRTALGNIVEAERQRAFFGLVEGVEDLNLFLGKALASGSAGQSTLLFADVWRTALDAQDRLSHLPLSHQSLVRTGLFLNQVGDYGYTLAKQIVQGEVPGRDQWEQAADLKTQASELSEELHDLYQTLGENEYRWSGARAAAAAQLGRDTRDLAADGLGRIERSMETYPTITYDGPFSDHVIRREPKGLTGQQVEQAEAERLALQFLPPPPEGRQYDVRLITETRGLIPAYTFRATEGPRDYFIDITKKGGHVVWMRSPRAVEDEKLTLAQVRAVAADFMKSRGLSDLAMLETVGEQNSGITTFVGKVGDVIVYPDMIKVVVARDNGEILGYEALGYLMSHHLRDLPSPELTEEQAVRMVSERLKVVDTRLVVIPTRAAEEILCWQVKGSLGGDQYLIYINALDGSEEQVLQVLPVEGGYITE